MNNTDKVIEILKAESIENPWRHYILSTDDDGLDKLARQINSLYQQEVSAEEITKAKEKHEAMYRENYSFDDKEMFGFTTGWNRAINWIRSKYPTASIESDQSKSTNK